MSTLRYILPLVGLFAAACAGGHGATTSGDEQHATEAAVLRFDASFHTTLSGKLRAGTSVTVHYDPARLPDCRMGLNDGTPGWTITGFSMLNGGTPQSFYVAGHSADPTIDPLHPPDARVELPHGGDLALFFQVTNAQGCSSFDSDFGENFHFPVAGASGGTKATLTLASDHSPPTLSGTLVAGGSLEIAYDPDRLGACRMEINGHPGWTITGFSIANGGAPRGFHVGGFNAVPVGDADANPVIDLTAGRLELFFQVTNGQGCSEFDSNSGQNYRFDVPAR